jgi:tRNA-intron endonuclease
MKLKQITVEKFEKEKEKIKKFKVYLIGNLSFSNSQSAFSLFQNSRIGEEKKRKIYYSFFETAYLLERNKIILEKNGKNISFSKFRSFAEKKNKQFDVKYAVFRDMKSRGYIIKTALKFGAEFRVYEKGKNIGEEHAKWILYPVGEHDGLTWHDFSAKNRVAHSTKKNLLIGIVDDESEVTYYEISWIRP